ncbi:ribonuclease Z [Longirhabdus pacifica]|uniref:ribonuclease Z n=1 Tax=Longirhabdus pacifica TaxID=2305227 RepID=UPI001008820C|nr:ribonuclease Z [Longirhabdus pacifica]
MDVLFLGTGAGMPSKERNVTSTVLKMLEERGTIWMFDCGEGTQHQILHSSLKMRKLEKLFITHLHGDHIYGLHGLLTSRAFQGGETPLSIYGPPGIRKWVEVGLEVSDAHLNYDLHIEEIEEGMIFEDEQVKVHVLKLDHRIDSYGYRIEEKDRPGKLRLDKLKQWNVPPGPIYADIKKGKPVRLDDGTLIPASDLLLPSTKGRCVSILGDTRICENSKALCKDADVVVHEATFDSSLGDLAYKYFHSTAKEVAQMAKECNVGTLILTHISSRYNKEEEDPLLIDIGDVFSPVFVAYDFWEYRIPSTY